MGADSFGGLPVWHPNRDIPHRSQHLGAVDKAGARSVSGDRTGCRGKARETSPEGGSVPSAAYSTRGWRRQPGTGCGPEGMIRLGGAGGRCRRGTEPCREWPVPPTGDPAAACDPQECKLRRETCPGPQRLGKNQKHQKQDPLEGLTGLLGQKDTQCPRVTTHST